MARVLSDMVGGRAHARPLPRVRTAGWAERWSARAEGRPWRLLVDLPYGMWRVARGPGPEAARPQARHRDRALPRPR